MMFKTLWIGVRSCLLILILEKLDMSHLTHFFPMHPFSTPWKHFWYFQGVEKGCIGNKWVNCPNTSASISVKMDGSVHSEQLSLKILRLLSFPSKLDLSVRNVCIGQTFSKKIGFFVFLWSYFLHLFLRFCFISINLVSNHLWNTVVMPWLVPLIATWVCWRSWRKGYVGVSLAASFEPFLCLEIFNSLF